MLRSSSIQSSDADRKGGFTPNIEKLLLVFESTIAGQFLAIQIEPII